MFKEGDIVRCIRADNPHNLKNLKLVLNQTYKIKKRMFDNDYVDLHYPYDGDQGLKVDRFILVKDIPLPVTYKGLYEEAKLLRIPNRSLMRKERLKQAIIDYREKNWEVAGVVQDKPVVPVVEPPKRLLEEVLREKTRDIPDTCSYAYETKSGRQIFHVRDICHARLKHVGGNKLALDVAGHRANIINEELYDEFIMYMMNESPCADRFLTKTLEEAYKSAILMDVDKGYNSVCTSAIMLRTASEHGYKLPTWKWFKDKGYSNNVSWLMTQGLQKIDGKWFTNGLGGWHETFEANMDVDDVIKFFRNGFHRPDENSFRENTKTYSIWNSIAGHVKSISLKSFFSKYSKQVDRDWNVQFITEEEDVLKLADEVKQLIEG